jgi:hypothetical protein
MAAMPFIEPTSLLSVHPPSLAEELARRLVDAGIDARLEVESARPVRRTEPPAGYLESEHTWGSQRMAARGGYGSGSRIQIYVSERDLERARSVESRFIREQVPDVPEDFDPQNLAPDRCPACDAQLPEEIQVCPECELAFHR